MENAKTNTLLLALVCLLTIACCYLAATRRNYPRYSELAERGLLLDGDTGAVFLYNGKPFK